MVNPITSYNVTLLPWSSYTFIRHCAIGYDTMMRTCTAQMMLSLARHLIENSAYVYSPVQLHIHERMRISLDQRKDRCRTTLFLIKDTFKEDKTNAQRRQEEIYSEVFAKGSQLSGMHANVIVATRV